MGTSIIIKFSREKFVTLGFLHACYVPVLVIYLTPVYSDLLVLSTEFSNDEEKNFYTFCPNLTFLTDLVIELTKSLKPTLERVK